MQYKNTIDTIEYMIKHNAIQYIKTQYDTIRIYHDTVQCDTKWHRRHRYNKMRYIKILCDTRQKGTAITRHAMM